jgi:hypothetical protein
MMIPMRMPINLRSKAHPEMPGPAFAKTFQGPSAAMRFRAQVW